MKKPQYAEPPSKDGSLHFHGIFKPEDSLFNAHIINRSCINNYLKVFSSIHQTLETNSDIVSLIPGFFEAREVFKEYVNNLSGKYSNVTGLLSENFFYSPEWRDEFDKDFDEAYSFVNNTLDNYLEKVKEQFPKFFIEYNSAKALLNSKEKV